VPAALNERDALHAVLAAWRAALHAGIEPADDFYACGGTSLSAADAAARLTSALGVAVPVAAVLRAGTARALASEIVAASASATGHAPPPLQACDGEPAPATVQQQAIWFLEQLDKHNRAYNTVVAIALDGLLRVDLLERALAALIERHPILRTTFHVRTGTLVQQVHQHGTLELDRVARDDDDQGFEAYLGSLGRRRFDIGALPLIRWTLVERTPDRFVLAQVEHHFVHDGWAMWILLTELAALYRSLATGGHTRLAPIALTYEDYARWQRHWLQSDEARRQCAWWTDLLGSAPHTLALPGDARRPETFTSEGQTVRVQLPATLRDEIRTAATRASVTPYAVMMSAFAALIGSTAHVETLTLGSMLRNRRVPGSESVVGMFVNTVAIPVLEWRGLPFDELARRLFTLLVEAQDRQEIPFPVVGRGLRLPRQLTRNPLFQVCFSMNDWPLQRLDFGPELSARVSYPSNGGAKFDLDVVLDDPQACTLLWRYYRPLFARDDVVALAARYEDVLARCAAGGGGPLGDLLAAAAG
jgi:hypothetical protein